MQSHFTQPTTATTINTAANTSEIINFDFDIYSQDTNSSDVLGHLSYPQELIPQGIFQEGFIDSPYNLSDSNASANFNNHHQILQISSSPAENFCYTPSNQSPLSNTSNTSPQIGISKNEQVPYLFSFSPQPPQPLVVSDSIDINSPFVSQLLLSPISNNTNNVHQTVGLQSGLSDLPFNINTPITPGLFLSPIVSFGDPDQCFSNGSSVPNTPFFVPPTPTFTTPLVKNDLVLYEDKDSNFYNLFDDRETFTNSFSLPQHQLGQSYPTYITNNSNNPNNFSNIDISMEAISPTENKVETSIENISRVISSPNSSGPSSGSVSASSSASPSAVEESISISHVENENATEVVNNATTSNGGSPTVSSPNSPVTTPHLVAIRPRPQEEENESQDPPRRSKRQRTRSMSDNDDENDEENEEKKYNCPDCGRGFNRKFNMQTHRQTHDPNRVKPFACEHPNCGSRFTRKHDLKRHINGIHKGEKVHECTSCHKPFSRKDAWKRHITTCGKM
ncbi:hypothetical protein Glove_345g17 [Diversispora epigaea]|uniref:C2H2-type domain-containing protein n=1 Tax=Diversispora epigaea TaxID=1348612 RepID=A0A397HKU1_9GLOM|nr:hypothetical protein Glove_345g17 [Diversispora epigaea]